MSRIILISGSTGIAAATGRLATDRGHTVFSISRDQPTDYEADLRDEIAVESAVQACLDRYARIDALFNVAGISGRRYGDGPLHECSADGWDTTMAFNAKTHFLLSREVVRHWLEIGQPGVILNMASVLAFSPEPLHFASHAYAASKGAILSLTKAMAAYYARHSIRVNAIAPGLVRTPMSKRAQADAEVLSMIKHKQPLAAGMLETDDIAQAALFLLSEESRHITGQILTVDGGWSVSG